MTDETIHPTLKAGAEAEEKTAALRAALAQLRVESGESLDASAPNGPMAGVALQLTGRSDAPKRDDIAVNGSNGFNGVNGTNGRHAKSANVTRASAQGLACLLYTSPSPRDLSTSRMPSSA